MSSYRVYEGIAGFWVGRAPWAPVNNEFHATKEAAEREVAELDDADNEAIYDYAKKLARVLGTE